MSNLQDLILNQNIAGRVVRLVRRSPVDEYLELYELYVAEVSDEDTMLYCSDIGIVSLPSTRGQWKVFGHDANTVFFTTHIDAAQSIVCSQLLRQWYLDLFSTNQITVGDQVQTLECFGLYMRISAGLFIPVTTVYRWKQSLNNGELIYRHGYAPSPPSALYCASTVSGLAQYDTLHAAVDAAAYATGYSINTTGVLY